MARSLIAKEFNFISVTPGFNIGAIERTNTSDFAIKTEIPTSPASLALPALAAGLPTAPTARHFVKMSFVVASIPAGQPLYLIFRHQLPNR